MNIRGEEQMGMNIRGEEQMGMNRAESKKIFNQQGTDKIKFGVK